MAGQSFYIQLQCHTLKKSYSWIVDVVSQIIFNNTITINFEITIGTSKQVLHDATVNRDQIVNADKIGTFHPLLQVTEWDTKDLWNLPVPLPNRPKHLVILTHGLHSNASADMLYLKEQIDAITNSHGEYVEEEVVVKAFFGNIGKTERGIKYLGSRVAEYIVRLVTQDESLNNGQVTKISFVGHSLGGCVQTFAIAYLRLNFPWFFEKIKPINFVAIASPLLGVANENPLYVQMVLSAGFVGKTGQELGLKVLENNSKPLLLLLPTGLTHKTLKQFKRRTLYANAINDGITPLRTSTLLYLDYKGISALINNVDGNNGDDKDYAKIDHTNKGKEGGVVSMDKTEKVPRSAQENNGFLPIQTFLSFFMPQKQNSESLLPYKNFQTQVGGNKQSEGKNQDEDHGDDEDNERAEKTDFKAIPNATFLDSAAALILPPMPSIKYIVDPTSRDNVIIHDKVYYEQDLPKRRSPGQTDARGKEGGASTSMSMSTSTSMSNSMPMSTSSSSSSSSIRRKIIEKMDLNNIEATEEEIAREYHKNMGWRKVVVKLKPDAHNNIIVRRRFANAYGWPVIQHLVEAHFGKEARKEEIEDEKGEVADEKSISAINSLDSLDEDLGLTKLISRDIITKENEEIDESTNSEEQLWINSKDNAESVFALGVTGLIGEVTDRVGDFGNQLYNMNFNPSLFPLLGQISLPAVLTSTSTSTRDDGTEEGAKNKGKGEGLLKSMEMGVKSSDSKEQTADDGEQDLGGASNGVMNSFL